MIILDTNMHQAITLMVPLMTERNLYTEDFMLQPMIFFLNSNKFKQKISMNSARKWNFTVLSEINWLLIIFYEINCLNLTKVFSKACKI